jgi:hypothetical protein
MAASWSGDRVHLPTRCASFQVDVIDEEMTITKMPLERPLSLDGVVVNTNKVTLLSRVPSGRGHTALHRRALLP